MTEKSIADAITLIAKKQLDTSAKFKQPRMLEILDTEDVLNYKLRPALQGRLNVPFDGVVLTGFVETLVAQVSKLPKVEFNDTTGANLKGSKKITAAWERDRKIMRLKMKDAALRYLAAVSGRGIAKFYAESDPKYKPHLKVIDYLDFHCEPNGGGHLDDHYFTGEENIFRSKDDLESGAKSGWYDPGQVKVLSAYYSAPDFKKTQDEFNNKMNRYTTLGLDMESHNYVGGQLYNLVEWVTYYQGKQYHLIFDKCAGIWLRCVELVKDFGNDLTPFLSFASPYADAFNFWNRGPADKIKPIAEAIRLNLNEILNNNRKRNWDMKVVDKAMFPNLKELDWRQDGVVSANVPMNGSIQNGIFSFQTPEISGALNLNAYLNNLAGEKLGVSAQTMGDAKEDKVGIYQGNSIQISKRMKLISDSYEEFYEDLCLRYDWGLWDHASEEEMVRIISTDGAGWEKITKEDKEPDYIVTVITSSAELSESDEEKKLRLDAIISVEKDPEQKALINLKALVEEKLTLTGFSQERIKKLLDKNTNVNDELLSEAKKAIEIILEGKDPGLNSSATTGYLQYISDWIIDNCDDIKPEVKTKLEEYFDNHVKIAIKNKEKEAFNRELLLGGALTPNMPQNPTAPMPAKPTMPAQPLPAVPQA